MCNYMTLSFVFYRHENILRSVLNPSFEPCTTDVTNKECKNFILLLSLFRKESPNQDFNNETKEREEMSTEERHQKLH